MKTKVAITVDTEPSIAGAFTYPDRYKPLIHEPVWGEVAGKSEALGFMIGVLRRHNLRATFFVETAHVAYFRDSIMADCARQLLQAGQDVQLHLHPAWMRFKGGEFAGIHDHCGRLDESHLVDLIVEGADRIETWCGSRPMCFRAGNFSASTGVYRAMKQAQMVTASNICIAVAPPTEKELHLNGGIHRIEGILELPATCFRDRGPAGRGRYRPLQIAACRFEELRRLLNAAHQAGVSMVTIITHPFEFLKWSGPDFSGLRANSIVQRRFDRLCGFLADNSDRFDVVGIDQIGPDSPIEDGMELDGDVIHATWRAIENFVNDRLPL